MSGSKLGGREFAWLEIRDEESREQVKEALSILWRATGCHYPGSLIPDRRITEKQLAVYEGIIRFVGETLLGSDCPEFETLT